MNNLILSIDAVRAWFLVLQLPVVAIIYSTGDIFSIINQGPVQFLAILVPFFLSSNLGVYNMTLSPGENSVTFLVYALRCDAIAFWSLVRINSCIVSNLSLSVSFVTISCAGAPATRSMGNVASRPNIAKYGDTPDDRFFVILVAKSAVGR